MRKAITSLCSVPVVVGLALSLKPTLHTSEAGLLHIANAEGCILCRYADPSGYATIGVGHRLAAKGPVRLTEAQVAQLYAQDVETAEKCVIEHLDGHYMPQSVYDASVSLVFNTGCAGALINPKTHRPTAYSRAANANDWGKACYYLGDFIYSNGVPLLRNRRAADQALCIKDIPNATDTTDTP